jgi:flagellar protein FlaG
MNMNISSLKSAAAISSESNSSSPKKEYPEAPKDNRNVQNESKVSDEFVKKSLDRMLQAIQPPDTTIERSVHDETKQVIYKIKDSKTGEVVRQFPEEKLLDAAAKLIELAGIMIDERV